MRSGDPRSNGSYSLSGGNDRLRYAVTHASSQNVPWSVASGPNGATTGQSSAVIRASQW